MNTLYLRRIFKYINIKRTIKHIQNFQFEGRMKAIFLLIFFLSPLLSLMAQDEEWLSVTDIESDVSVLMPEMPKYEKAEDYFDEHLFSIDVFVLKMNNLDLHFETQSLNSFEKKAVKKTKERVIQLTAIRNNGKPGNKQVLSKDGSNYTYTEISLAGGGFIRSVLFDYNQRVIHVYVKGAKSNVFGIDANQFLGSWTLPEMKAPVKIDENSMSEEIEHVEIEEANNWFNIKIDQEIEVMFPDKPYKKTTIVQKNNNDVPITAYAYADKNGNHNYVVTQRKFGADEGQLKDEALYSYVLDQLIEQKKMKLIKDDCFELDGLQGKTFILSNRTKFFKLQLLRIDDSIYQFMLKGKRKSVHDADSDLFFNNISILN